MMPQIRPIREPKAAVKAAFLWVKAASSHPRTHSNKHDFITLSGQGIVFSSPCNREQHRRSAYKSAHLRPDVYLEQSLNFVSSIVNCTNDTSAKGFWLRRRVVP
jgi:hypothetical protein